MAHYYDKVVHCHVAAVTLAGQALASMFCGNSVGAKCFSDNFHEILRTPESDLGCEGERLPGHVLVGVRDGGSFRCLR